MKKKYLAIGLALIVVGLGVFSYWRTHNYMISKEAYTGVENSARKPMDGIEIKAESNGKTIKIIVVNHSGKDIDLSLSEPVPDLYIKQNDGWHSFRSKGNSDFVSGLKSVVGANNEKTITINCANTYGGYLPEGLYGLEFQYEECESGIKHRNLLAFEVK